MGHLVFLSHPHTLLSRLSLFPARHNKFILWALKIHIRPLNEGLLFHSVKFVEVEEFVDKTLPRKFTFDLIDLVMFVLGDTFKPILTDIKIFSHQIYSITHSSRNKVIREHIGYNLDRNIMMSIGDKSPG